MAPSDLDLLRGTLVLLLSSSGAARPHRRTGEVAQLQRERRVHPRVRGMGARRTSLRPMLAIGCLTSLSLLPWSTSTAQTAQTPTPHVRLPATPAVIITGPRSDDIDGFTRLSGAAHFPDGAIVVADDGAVQVTLFARDGTFERHIGRKGRGPAEYGDVHALQLRGDTIIVIDGRRSVHFFSRRGAWIASRTLPSLDGYLTNPAVGALGGTHLVLQLRRVKPPIEPNVIREDSIGVWSWGATGAPRPLTVVPTGHHHRRADARGRTLHCSHRAHTTPSSPIGSASHTPPSTASGA